MRTGSLLLVVFLFTFCGQQQGGTYVPEELDRREKTRYQQYLIQGKILYKQHCEVCHQQDGQGMARLYPPLAGSDYLLENIPRAACILKNGQEGEIIVNGITFNMKMPGVPTLTDLEIAEILTYVSNNWGNKNGFVPVQEVQKYLRTCDTTDP